MTIVKEPFDEVSFDGVKNPCASHQGPHADSIALGLYALVISSSSEKGRRIFFCPGGVCSIYSNTAEEAKLFLVADLAGAAPAAGFCLAANFLAFSAFFLFFSVSFSFLGSREVLVAASTRFDEACGAWIPSLSTSAEARVDDMTDLRRKNLIRVRARIEISMRSVLARIS